MSIEELNGWKAREYDALKARVAELESVRDDLSRAYAVQGLALEEERTRVAELEAGISTAMQLIEGGFDSAAYEALEALNAHK